jgi:hypothetical protein
MEAGQLSISSLNWYLQSLRRYCLDNSMEWEGIRQTEGVRIAMAKARKIAAESKRKKELEKKQVLLSEV